jgi:hypothetical protein
VIPLSLMAAAAFNLVCHTAYIGVAGDAPQKVNTSTGPFFKVDLGSGKYCAGSCSETFPIAKVTETELFLNMEDTPAKKIYLRISRESGEYISNISFGKGLPNIETGTCESQPFTGFPKRKF